MDDNQLTHHGVKGMKWGVIRTPEQLGHKTSTAKKKKLKVSGSLANIKKKISNAKKAVAAKKAASAKKAAEKKAENEKKSKEEFEKAKKKAIESGTAEEVLKYKGKMTNAELMAAVNRLNMEGQLSQMHAKTVKTGMDKAEEFMGKVDRVKGMAEKGISAWNVYAKIHNSLSPDELPVIDGNYKDRKEAKAEKARKKAEEAEAKARKKLVESGTATEIANNFGKFSAKELTDINTRFAMQDKIAERWKRETQASTPKRDAQGNVVGSDAKPSTASPNQPVRDVPKATTERGKAYVNNLLGPGQQPAGLLGPGKSEESD